MIPSKRVSLTLCFTYASVLFALAQTVDPLTGRLQMSIPIGTLQANDISIPISIYHHGGSLMVAEGANSCGPGWGLSAAGAVSRQVRGLPDELNGPTYKGWLFNNAAVAWSVNNFGPTANDDLSTCTDEVNDYNMLEVLHENYKKDTEPDLFYINAPGLSAQFVFGTDGQPKLLTHQDIIIQFNPLTNPNSLTVITNNGFTYAFGGTQPGQVEYVNRTGYVPDNTLEMNTYCRYYKDQTMTINTSWKLVSITSSATGTTANFTYKVPNTQTPYPKGAGKYHYNIDSTTYIFDRYYLYDLESITLKSYTATFRWYNDHLSSVTIVENNTQEKVQTEMEYINVSSNSVSKSFLKSIKQQNGINCFGPQVYSFEYDQVSFTSVPPSVPTFINWKKYWGQDFFGYPNAVTTNKNKPILYFATAENDSRRLRTIPISGTSYVTISGENRTPATSASFGALRKVKLPTGGYVEFEYEANTYMDNSISPAQQYSGMGVRVRKVISQGGEVGFAKTVDDSNLYRAIVKEYEYKLAGSSNSSGVIMSPVKLGYITAAASNAVRQVVTNLGDEPIVLYSRTVEKIAGKGYTVYEFNVPGVFPQTAAGEWKATKSRIARMSQSPCIPANSVKNGFYLFPYPPSSNYDFKRGTISKVATYSETGGLVYEKTTTYTTRTSNATIVKGLRFEKIGNVYYYGLYELLTGRVDFVNQEIIKEASLEDPTKVFQTTINYTYNANHMLSAVTTTLPNSTSTVRNLKYAKDFPFTSPPSSDTTAIAIKALNTNNRGATLIEEWSTVTVPGSAAVTSAAKIMLYRDFGNGRIMPYYVKTLPPGASFTPASMSGQNFVHDNTNYRLLRTLKEYDSEGRLLTEMDDRKNTVSTHYYIDMAVKAATFANARAQQSVYEGFESPTSFGMTTAGSGFSTVAGWTGEKALQFTSATSSLQSSSLSTNLIQKNGNKYRVSCWVYSPSGRTVTFRAMVGGSSVSFVTLTNSVNNAWNYLEGELSTSAVSSTFWLKVETNAASGTPVVVDDVICMPQQARVALQTLLPFKGLTSATDDRGLSVKTTYDYLGRPVSTLDRNRNLIERMEYSTKTIATPKPPVGFEPGTSEHFINTPLSFTPVTTWICDPSLNLSWEVDGVGRTSGAGSVLTHTFTTPGIHNVKLTSTSLTYGSSDYTQTICVQYKIPGPINYTVTNFEGQPAGLVLDCNSGLRNINLQLPSAPSGCVYKITWTKNGQPYDEGSIISVSGYSPPTTTVDQYVATITLDCSAYKECTATNFVAYSGTVNISVTNNPNPYCQ